MAALSLSAGRPRPSLLVWLRSTLYAAGLVASTLVYAPLALLCFPLPYPTRYRIITGWTRFNLWWLRLTCGLTHVVEGIENVPGEPAVVLCKHQSAWETLALQLVFVPQVWVLKRELLRLPFFGWGLAMLRPIAIDRSAGRRAVEQVVEQGTERLQTGSFVVVFPEGTRVPPGQKRRYKQGGAVLAQRSGRPVIPVAVNSGEYWPRNSFLKYPGRIRMVVGPPIPTHGLTPAMINTRAERWIEDTVAHISDRAPAVEVPLNGHADTEEKA